GWWTGAGCDAPPPSPVTAERLADPLDAPPPERIGDGGTAHVPDVQPLGGHRPRGSERPAQQVGLRVGLVLASAAAAHVGLAGKEKALDAFRTAQRVQGLEPAEDGVRAHLSDPVAVEVVARHHDGELAEPVWGPVALAQRLHQLCAAAVVIVVRGPFLAGRRALAEVMH